MRLIIAGNDKLIDRIRTLDTTVIASTRRIAIIDDDPLVVCAEQDLLEREGHEVRTAESIGAGIALVRDFEPELVLLDYLFPTGSGADVVRAIREFNHLTQVILVSGISGSEAVRKLLAELDIQGFHYKQDGNARLLLHVDAVLKHAGALRRLERQQHYLHAILQASPELSRLGSAAELFRTTLQHSIGLVRGPTDSLTTSSGAVLLELAGKLTLQAACGELERSELPDDVAQAARACLGTAEPELRGDLVTIPFETRSHERGCVIVRSASLPSEGHEPCQLLMSQFVQALENVRLYQRATVDPLTEVFNRDFGQRRLEEVLSLGSRNDHDTGVVLLDVDHFKRLNDTHGHAAGDLALRAVASALRDACRGTDIVSRYGGEEFFLTLPSTSLAGALTIAERVLAAIRELEVRFEDQRLRVTASAGVAVAAPGTLNGEALLRRADLALYQAKSEGRDRVCQLDDGEPVRRAVPA